jgi:hypothetical protein
MSRLPPNPTLKQLEALIGDWEVEVPNRPAGMLGTLISDLHTKLTGDA